MLTIKTRLMCLNDHVVSMSQFQFLLSGTYIFLMYDGLFVVF